MARYAILSEVTRDDGKKIYEVILEADDGYQETQTYIGDSEQILVGAINHFNAERLKMTQQKADAQEVVFVDVN